MNAAELPDVFGPHEFARFLGLSYSAFAQRRNRRDWPFSPIPGFPSKGKAARWSRQHVMNVINGQPAPRATRPLAVVR